MFYHGPRLMQHPVIFVAIILMTQHMRTVLAHLCRLVEDKYDVADQENDKDDNEYVHKISLQQKGGFR